MNQVAILFFLVLLAANFCLAQPERSGVVTSVYDGNQFQIDISEPYKLSVTLYGVFAPNRRTNEGSASRLYLRNLVSGKNISIKTVEALQDQKISVLAFLENGDNINELVLKHGWGFFDNFKTYINRTNYQKLEGEAKNKKIGIWAYASLTLPDELKPFTLIKTLRGRVINVYDGDTMTLQTNEKTPVRFHGIDCPELNQESGVQARDFSRSLILNKEVTVEVADIDRYGRHVGVIKTADGLVANEEMIKNGWAWHYRQYSKFPEWQELEDLARTSQKGIWSLASPPQAPWEYRRGAKKYTDLETKQSQSTGFQLTNPNIEEFEGPVISVADGDTFTVSHQNQRKRLRLYGIDSPERNQPGGDLAKEFAEQLVMGKIVKVEVKSMDKYKRRVAVVILPNGDVYNEKALENGFAWHYKRYSDDESYAILEQSARSNRLGIWGLQSAPITPWDWRKGARS